MVSVRKVWETIPVCVSESQGRCTLKQSRKICRLQPGFFAFMRPLNCKGDYPDSEAKECVFLSLLSQYLHLEMPLASCFFVESIWRISTPRSHLSFQFCWSLARWLLSCAPWNSDSKISRVKIGVPREQRQNLPLTSWDLLHQEGHGHHITSSCQYEQPEAGMRDQFPSFLPKEKSCLAKLSSVFQDQKKKKTKAVAQRAYPLLAYSFGYSFTAVYISNNPFNFFREMLYIYTVGI